MSTPMAETQSAPSLRELSEAAVAILYRNWRGEVAVRQIVPGAAARAFWFGSTEWHPEPQWLVTATDVEKNASRDFALSGILAWGAEAIAAREATLTEAVAAARAEGVREGLERALEVIGPTGHRPCDCDRCDCGNAGDLAEVAAWDAENDLSRAIRALILTPPTTPGGR